MESICSLCPRRCNTRRTESTGEGFCGQGFLPRLARAALHHWEEPCISGMRGSGTVFFSGCVLKCVYCQNYELSSENFGEIVSVERLAEIYRELEEQGAHNINLVNPTQFVPAILESFQIYRPKVPVVYNSSGYERVETLRTLEGFVDIYLPDFKYSNNEKAARYSGVKDYAQTALKAICEMARQTGEPVFDEDGILQKGTIVRHLVLPANTMNSITALRLLSKHLPKGTLVSLMGQYLPCGRAEEYAELSRRITRREYEKVQDALFDTGLDGFVQQLSSAKKKFIPDFSLQGVNQPDIRETKSI